MPLRPRTSVMMVLALSAVAATAFAYVTTAEPQPTLISADAPTPQVTDVDEHAMAPAAEEAPQAPSDDEEAAATPATGNPAAVPHMEHYALPSTIVTAPRPSEDELLRTAVVDRLAADSRLSGRIGVETYHHVVSLTGRVSTTGQRDHAEQVARGVDGVWDVQNLIRTRVGES